MYGLPKLHKNDVPLRPILVGYSAASTELAKFLVPLLQPLTISPYNLSNSYDFFRPDQDPKPFATYGKFRCRVFVYTSSLEGNH